MYQTGYHDVLFNVAMHTIAETASNYTAYNFFNDKQTIALNMTNNLNNFIKDYMFLTVETLQLVLVQLPEAFENAIMESINMKQNITQTEKQLANLQVSFQTQLQAAVQSANQTVTLAEGKAKEIHYRQSAAAAQITQSIAAEATAFALMKNTMKLSNAELLDYIWFDMMASQQSSAQVVVGMNPSTFVQSIGASKP